MNTEIIVEAQLHEATSTWSFVVSQDTDAVLIDPVLDFEQNSGRVMTDSARALLRYVEERGLRLHRILETHAHADHLSAAAFVKATTSARVGVGQGIVGVQAHFAPIFALDPASSELTDAFDDLLSDGQVIAAGQMRIEVMALPGHTPDSLGYRIGDNLFIGDTLFAPDIGTARCDFPGGSAEALFASIQRIYALGDDTVLWLCHDYPPEGREHRASVTVAESRRSNRMLSGQTTLADFSQARSERDANLAVPQLLLPSLQVNIRGGRLPRAEPNGERYLRLPLRVQEPADGLLF